ncbi:hypothetical protein ACQ4M3_29840 [Leptolyngbya sp. AN03gr2]|uniref:hypothetical protein n=1 Tax=unclassified Leptolyngbya TaxID=2650499 RepID=UPI003D31C9C4
MGILQNSLQAKEAEITRRENDVQARETQIQELQAKVTRSSLAYDSKEVEGKIQAELGDEVWKQLSETSRKNLVAAIINYKIARKRDFLNDYSEAVTRLCLVVETEIVIPFFEKFYEFLCARHNHGPSTFEIAGVQLREEQVYTIGQLPRLISRNVFRFRKEKLNLEILSPSDKTELYYQFRFREQLDPADEELIQIFLNQWSHPLAKWLKNAEESASMLEKIRQIRNRAPHPSSVYEWHFRHLYKLITGREGLLQQLHQQELMTQSPKSTESRETSRGQRILSIRSTRRLP